MNLDFFYRILYFLFPYYGGFYFDINFTLATSRQYCMSYPKKLSQVSLRQKD